MSGIRRLAWLALVLAYVHTVFGAIVRISGSGLGCGEHWPDCNGSVVPTVTSYTVVVEVSHRYLAAMLLLAIITLVCLAFTRRRAPGSGGQPSVLGPAVLALALVLTAAVVGMVVVKLSLSNPYVIVVHYSLAMMTLATLVVAVQRAGGLGADVVTGPSDAGAPTYRGARAAAGLAFIVVVLGALTANVPGAALSCGGFPWCRTGVFVQGTPLHIQLTHRVLAILLFLHLGAGTVLVMRRGASRQVVAAAQITFGVVVLQLVVAAALVELRLPPALQSLHQAVGTLLWVTTFTYAAIARRAFLAHTGPAPSVAARGAAA